jgi:hypothetical protein
MLKINNKTKKIHLKKVQTQKIYKLKLNRILAYKKSKCNY